MRMMQVQINMADGVEQVNSIPQFFPELFLLYIYGLALLQRITFAIVGTCATGVEAEGASIV